MAKIDLGSVIGPRGERGSIIYQGTAITGTKTEGTVFEDSGIEYALQEDKYLNTLTNNMYTCITEGDADTAEWAWIGNIQGKQGLPGEPGPTGKVDMNTPIDYTPAKTRQEMQSGDSIGILMGKIDKNFEDMTDAAYLPVVNDLKTARAGEGVLDAYQGKVLLEKLIDLEDKLGSNIRYNSDTDMVQIYYNDKWVGWTSAGIQVFKDIIPMSGGTITASSTYSGYPITNVLDGNVSTAWYSEVGVSTPTIEYTFPITVIIVNITLESLVSDINKDTEFYVDTSKNGNVYEQIGYFSYTSSEKMGTFSLGGVPCDKIRIRFVGSNISSYNYVGISDIKAKGRY